MFGYVTPLISELKVKEYERYKAVYCGLCRAMKQRVCHSSRLTLSYDFVFLALLRTELEGESITTVRRRCVAHPFKKRLSATENKSLGYAARAGALMAYYKLADDIGDSRGVRRLARRLLMPTAKRFRRLSRMGECDSAASALLEKLNRLEKAGDGTPDAAADIFGQLTAQLFSGELDGDAGRIAYEAGYRIGRWIYLIDAADDLGRDRRDGTYNPFSDEPDEGLDERIDCSLALELAALEKAINLITFGDSCNEGIIKNILYYGLPSRREAVKAGRNVKKSVRKGIAE